MLQTVKDLAVNQDMTIIYVTHYPEEILPMFDHCALMKDGTFYQVGKTRDIFTKENLSQFIQHDVDLDIRNDHFYVSMQVESVLGQ